jgi:transposase
VPRLEAAPIKLLASLRRRLARRGRSTTASYRDVLRARIILLADAGRSVAATARELGCMEKTVRKWRGRWLMWSELEILDDASRTGRPPRIPITAHHELIKLACRRMDKRKAPFRQVWTLRALSAALRRETGVEMSKSEVARVLDGAALRPHRVRMWLHSPDPDFRSKVQKICELYVSPPANAAIVCVDEKPGMQALEHRYPMRLAAPQQLGRKEFEYRRRGTVTLIAAFDARSGQVFGQCRRRTAKGLVAFMEALAKRYPTGPVYVVWDNLNTHHGDRWRAFNERHRGRFHFVHTPLHASWVNQIEIWFSILARRVLKHGSFASRSELRRRVLAFIAHWNRAEAHPFRWSFRGKWKRDGTRRAA